MKCIHCGHTNPQINTVLPISNYLETHLDDVRPLATVAMRRVLYGVPINGIHLNEVHPLEIKVPVVTRSSEIY